MSDAAAVYMTGLTQDICKLQSTDCIADVTRVSSGRAESQISPIVTTSGEDFSDRFIRAV